MAVYFSRRLLSPFAPRKKRAFSEFPATFAERTATLEVPSSTASGVDLSRLERELASATTLAMLLKLLGNETRTAFDGLAALEAAETFKPDVVMLDIGLPKLNGYEVCRKMRGDPWGKSIVVIALTGWGQKEDLEKSHEAGFDHHLVKPVDIAVLTKLLAEWPLKLPLD